MGRLSARCQCPWRTRLLIRNRAALLATACLLPLVLSAAAQAQGTVPRAQGQQPPAVRLRPANGNEGAIATIRIEGNQRIEEGTIRSYMLVQPGDSFDPDRIDRSLKTLFATGLFQDVTLRRDGSALVVRVQENPIVNRIAFEGNRKQNDEALRAELQLRARAVFTPQMAQADRQRILDSYAKRGRFAATVEPKVIRLDQNRVDVVFEVNEGETTLVSRINMVGNRAFSENRLREIINSREQAFYRLLSSSDQYDPEKINFDKELLRRFYLKNGYADFEVRDATAELSPDRRAFFVTFTLNEGERYDVGEVSIDSKLRNLNTDELKPLLEIGTGDTYDGDLVERTTQAIQDAVQNRGFAFVEVRPRIARDRAKKTVDLVFDITEGPRVFVERIDISGNTRTKDKVIRREFRLAEGDAFNAATVRRSRQRLQDLGYFNSVQVVAAPGSTPDRASLNAVVDEKATGELTLGGGFSTDAGALVNVGLRERNLIGTGIDASINGVLAQRRSQIDLSITDPYFLDRNLVAGFDLFHVRNDNQDIAAYNERRTGGAIRVGYEYNERLRQALTYTLVDRNIFNVQDGASLYVTNQQGSSLLSQVGQTLALDYRDSRTEPREGFLLRLGTDVAGLGGTARYVRTKIDGTYYIPLERYFGDSEWNIAVSAGAGYLATLGREERIIDRFFLGGDNLRGFQSGGAGPQAVGQNTVDSIGGRMIYTQSTELRFPLPISADLGLTGRAFVDVGSLSDVTRIRDANGQTVQVTDDATPRVGAGVGVSWKTPFGLINVDIAQALVKRPFDQTQVFRFGFGTRF
ncbi:MAG: outer membrane protein assembly factor BamA [Gemmatimonadaceae bacterium]|nr:outer membrane protein assembly factor BamA [Acetobacteraceae bacterium]